MNHLFVRLAILVAVGILFGEASAAAQTSANQAVQAAPNATIGAPSVVLPPDYVIGVEDQLSIVFWRDKELSADVVVRPDGMISVPLLNDVKAVGFTPEQLGQVLIKAASKYIGDPTATVIVRQINSRKVFILGQVTKPGGFPLIGDMNVLQLIASAGGVLEYADASKIVIVRPDNGSEKRFKFNYKDVVRGKDAAQNILLKPGDTVIVP